MENLCFGEFLSYCPRNDLEKLEILIEEPVTTNDPIQNVDSNNTILRIVMRGKKRFGDTRELIRAPL